ncbi:unnamed protein product, partial [Lampetra fluviatilis]
MVVVVVRRSDVSGSWPPGLHTSQEGFCPTTPLCRSSPSHSVGSFKVTFAMNVTVNEVTRSLPDVTLGGHWRPARCRPRQRVAIIIPFLVGEFHLSFWLRYVHPMLQRQQIEYRVYLINQHGEETFNKAKLMNVGYVEASRDGDFDCFIFHDVDLIPMNDHNLYRCYEQPRHLSPRHLSVAVDKFKFKLPYTGIFGGVSGLSREQFLKINGFPNSYWGWGGEDDDIYNRVIMSGMEIHRPRLRIGKYRMIKHTKDPNNARNPRR